MSNYKVGQKIRIVKPQQGWEKLLGKTGVIKEIFPQGSLWSVIADLSEHHDAWHDLGFRAGEFEVVPEVITTPGVLYLYYPGDGHAYGPYRAIAVDGDETWVKPVPSPGEHPDTPWDMGFVVKTNELKALSPYAPVDKSK